MSMRTTGDEPDMLGRYRAEPAPDGLRLVQELLNTIPDGAGRPDLLADPDTATAWAIQALNVVERDPGDDALSDSETRALGLLRDAVRRSLVARDEHDADPVRAGRPAALLAHLGDDGTVEIVPRDAGVGSLRAWILLELYAAQLTGGWARLKVCRNPECRIAFYDRSRNTSAVWHDVKGCGNQANLRASRARRRTGTD